MSLERPVAPDPYDVLPAAPTLALTSDDIRDGEPLDDTFAHGSVCGQNLSPHPARSGFPDQTRGYVVT